MSTESSSPPKNDASLAYESLLRDFSRIPKEENEPTFMQIAGYPHYENVCSNILSFYLNPAESHGLGDLLLKALFQLAGETLERPIDQEVSIVREDTTDKKKRIDLVISGEDFVITIENKIFHWLANDLSHYEDSIKKKHPSDHRFIFFVLSPRKEIILPESSFISITYDELFAILEPQLGNRLAKAQPKWLLYFVDFIETIKSFTPDTMEFTKTDQFFIENSTEVENLIHAFNSFQGNLSRQIHQLKESFQDDFPQRSLLSRDLWMASKICLVFDMEFHIQYKVASDLIVAPSGWRFEVFGRNQKSQAFLNRFKGEFPLAANGPLTNDQRHALKRWDVGTSILDIREDIRLILDKLHHLGTHTKPAEGTA